MKDEVSHILVLVQVEHFNAVATGDRLRCCAGIHFVPLELDTIMVPEQITRCDPIIEGVLNFDSVENGSGEVNPAIDLTTDMGSDFNVLCQSRCHKNETGQY